MERTTAAQILANSKNKIFLYGPPGDGKTTLASQHPSTLYIACPPVEVDSIGTDPTKRDMPILRVRSIEAARDAVEDALKAKEELIVFDSTTKLRQYCVTEAIKKVPGPISQATWTESNRIFLDIIRPLIDDIKHHVILVGHHRKVKDELTKRVDIVPDFGESLINQMFPDLAAAFYYRKEGGSLSNTRKLYTTGGKISGIELKTRYHIDDVYTDPTLDTIFVAIDKYRAQAQELIDGSEASDRDNSQLPQ